MLALLALVWGTNWALFPYAVREVSVWTFRTVSMIGAGLVLLVAARAMGLSLIVPRRHWRTLFVAAMLYLVTWNIASTYSAVLLPSGQSAVLGFTMPLWAALLSWAFLGERPGGRLLAAVGLGALAVLLLMVPSFVAYADAPAGLACGLLAGLGWAAGTLVLKRGAVDVPAPVLTGWQMLVAAVPITAVALVVGDHDWFVPSGLTLLTIAYITFVPMSIGNVCWFAIVGLLPANVAGLSSIVVPIVAMISGAVLHGEPLGPVQWLAMGCCALALGLVLLKPPAMPA